AYGPQNDVTLKMPAFEWVHVQLHQQKGMISLSPPTICNSADILRSVLLKQPEKLNTAYWRATRKLRLKLFGKIVKSRCLTAPALRKWIMRSGVAHIPQLKD
ncbi:hypothetical protein NQD81_13200, partial [Escherichia coli]|nr:hypothetical protein [Escherichia coli]MDR5955010.1 hypothetical protein [Escherichia coli]MDR6013239.1 hypothetical protein [Escherichia coli]